VGFDFTSVWAIDPNINNGFPYLQALPPILHGIDYTAQGKTSTSNVDLAAISTYNGSGSNTYTGGTRFVGAYIGCTAGHLRLNPDTALFSKNNLMIVSLFERAPNIISYFTTKQANSDVMDAILAAHTAGQVPLFICGRL
jgi:hypothetical protein